MKKFVYIFLGIVVIFLIASYNRGKEIVDKSSSTTVSSNSVSSGEITDTQAITMACEFVKININGATDFSQKKADLISDVNNAFYVQGHFVVNGVEYKFGVPVHYISGDWASHRNWEWAKMEIVQVGTTNLQELHGTWNYSMF